MTNRKHFIDELNELNHKAIEMGRQVHDSFRKLIVACESQSLELAQAIVEQDKLINELEISINVDAYLLIARQCPVASDLRRTISVLKISNELERIGDYAVNVARYIIKTKNNNEPFLKAIIELATLLLDMLDKIMTSFANEDVQLALDVSESDEVMDNKYRSYIREWIKLAKTADEAAVEEAMRAVLIVKQIERAGDHVVNIAENIVYLVNGKRIELD